MNFHHKGDPFNLGGSKVTNLTSRALSSKPKTNLSTVLTKNERIQRGIRTLFFIVLYLLYHTLLALYNYVLLVSCLNLISNQILRVLKNHFFYANKAKTKLPSNFWIGVDIPLPSHVNSVERKKPCLSGWLLLVSELCPAL